MFKYMLKYLNVYVTDAFRLPTYRMFISEIINLA